MKNLIQYNFWAGLRISELIALKWSDIDFKNGLVNVERARVENTLKTTKTKSGVRKILLLKPAREALENQLLLTASNSNEFVFHDLNTNKEWSSGSWLYRQWALILKQAN